MFDLVVCICSFTILLVPEIQELISISQKCLFMYSFKYHAIPVILIQNVQHYLPQSNIFSDLFIYNTGCKVDVSFITFSSR